MNLYGYEILREDDLMHHGIKGQKWGQRRFQNEDGTWTAAGKERYGDDGSTGGNRGSFGGRANSAANTKNTPEAKARAEKLKKAAKIGAAIAGTALVAYGAYKLNKVLNDNTSKHYKELADHYYDRWGQHTIAAEGYALGGKRPEYGLVSNTSEKFERSMAKENMSRAREYSKLAKQGKYSAREKIDTAKRIVKGITRR